MLLDKQTLARSLLLRLEKVFRALKYWRNYENSSSEVWKVRARVWYLGTEFEKVTKRGIYLLFVKTK